MTISIADARAEALFVSDLSTTDFADATLVRAAIQTSVRAHHGVRGCAADVADEFGHHPDTAVTRMCRCRVAVADTYGRTRRDLPQAVAA